MEKISSFFWWAFKRKKWCWDPWSLYFLCKLTTLQNGPNPETAPILQVHIRRDIWRKKCFKGYCFGQELLFRVFEHIHSFWASMSSSRTIRETSQKCAQNTSKNVSAVVVFSLTDFLLQRNVAIETGRIIRRWTCLKLNKTFPALMFPHTFYFDLSEVFKVNMLERPFPIKHIEMCKPRDLFKFKQ